VSQAVEDRGIRAGKVNCDTHQRLCQEAQVNAYPSVRFYSGSSQTRRAQVSTRFTQVSKKVSKVCCSASVLCHHVIIIIVLSAAQDAQRNDAAYCCRCIVQGGPKTALFLRDNNFATVRSGICQKVPNIV